LNTFVEALVGITELLAEADWQSVQRAVGEDVLTGFLRQVTDVSGQIDLLSVGWDQMGLLDRARDVQEINRLFEQTLNGVIEMLRQIDQLRQSINQGWDRLREQWNLGAMTPSEQQGYYRQQIEALLGQLGGATSLEEINRINAELMRYTQSLMGIIPDRDALADWTGRETWGEFIERVMAEAQEIANRQLDAAQERVQEAWDTLVAQLHAARDGLIDFNEMLDQLPGGGRWRDDQVEFNPVLDIKVPMAIEVNNYLDGADIQSIIQYEVQQAVAELVQPPPIS
jgi:hypothetical protein